MNLNDFKNLSMEDKIAFLKNRENKKSIFKYENIDELISVLDELDLCDYLFDSAGVNVLYYLSIRVQRNWVNCIMNSNIRNKLLNNKYFCMYIIENIDRESDFNLNINFKENKYFFDYVLNHHYINDINLFLNIAFMFDEEGKNYLFNNYPITKKSIIISDIFRFSSRNLEWIFNNLIVNLCDYSMNQLYDISLTNATIPSFLFNNDFLNKLNSSNNIALSRKIISDLSFNSDTSVIEKHREKYFDSYLKQYNGKMLNDYNLLFNEIINTKYNEKTLDKLIDKYFNQDNTVLKEKIKTFMFKSPSFDEIEKFFIQESNEMISNIIIDYHFKDVYYNVLINIKELLEFENSNITISLDKIELYKRIINIDKLNYEEKIMLHEELKKYDLITMLYDDIFACRELIGNLIKNNILTKEKIARFKNEELSSKYGIDVYVLEGEEFYALAKTGDHHDKDLMYARSYSLLGKNAVTVYGGGGYTSEAFLYDGITPEQIVHVFPTDSFTKYDRNRPSTNRVNVLMEPKELINNTNSYNELLILERGKKNSEMDNRIPELKRFALYTYDEIKESDIEVAKKENVGIVIVKRKKYEKNYSEKSFEGLKYYGSNSQNNLDNIRNEITR